MQNQYLVLYDRSISRFIQEKCFGRKKAYFLTVFYELCYGSKGHGHNIYMKCEHGMIILCSQFRFSIEALMAVE